MAHGGNRGRTERVQGVEDLLSRDNGVGERGGQLTSGVLVVLALTPGKLNAAAVGKRVGRGP